MAKKSTKQSTVPLGLVGRAFVVWGADNKITYRGIVRGQLSDSHFLLQYGGANMQIVDLAEMAKPTWQFYEDDTRLEEHLPSAA